MNSNMQTLLLDSLCDALKQMIPTSVQQGSPDQAQGDEAELGVAIGYAHPISVRMVIDGQREMFSRMSGKMFGMEMEGEMLDSCVGEMANIIAGGTTTILSNLGIQADITPPSLMKDFGSSGQGVAVPIRIEEVGNLRIVLLANE